MRQTSDPSADKAAKSQLSVLITRGLNFGERHQVIEEKRGRGNIPKSQGNAHSPEKLSRVLLKSDLVPSKLETIKNIITVGQGSGPTESVVSYA